MKKKTLVENTLSVVGGAGLGAALMYLFDPDQGPSRRRDVKHTAGDAVTRTHEAIGSTLHATGDGARKAAQVASGLAGAAADWTSHAAGQASDAASDTVDNLHGHAHDLIDRIAHIGKHGVDAATGSAENLRSHGHDLIDRLHHMGRRHVDRASAVATAVTGRARQATNDASDSASSHANDLFDRARGNARSVWNRTGRATGLQEESHPVATATGITAGAVGAVAVGVGLMYFFDPRLGRGRRNYVADQITSLTRRTGKTFRRYGRHTGNLVQGAVAESRGYARNAGTHFSDAAVQARGAVENLRAQVREHAGNVVDQMKQTVASSMPSSAGAPENGEAATSPLQS